MGGAFLDVFEVIEQRRSIRAFTGKEVSEADVKKILDAARMAPSAGNIQPWTFIVARKGDVKRRLAEAALNQRFIEEASVVIVVCADEEKSARGYGSRGKHLYCIQDAAAATENMLLAAVGLGLGACWVGAFRENDVRETLKLPFSPIRRERSEGLSCRKTGKQPRRSS
ncbi:nitroreductase family protein [Candidatus Bathyarchaeota archaeon ex4484_231]|nr:MAG: nitroreductase family protein [Candidatus Bathyarchaeota archaeon ex4484_231]